MSEETSGERPGDKPPVQMQLRRVLDATPGPPASPLRWLLVIVPLIVIAAGISYLASAWMAAPPPRIVREKPKAPPQPKPQQPKPRSPFKDDQPSVAPSKPRAGAFNIDAVMAALVEAQPENGVYMMKRCVPCHSAARGAPPRLANTLWGIVGKRVAADPDYTYSAALRAKGGTWTFRELAEYLHNPRAHVPGTSMTFAGINDNERMAELLAYLRLLSDDPVPLPK